MQQQQAAKPECATRCFEHKCDSVDLRYGKYCGVGHGGCAGEKPCDAADACCKEHDECVGTAGLLATTCHKDFIECLDQVLLSGKRGFSKTCPYSTVIPTMRGGIQLTMMLGDAFGGAFGGQLRQQ